jgi:hypothetical protein
VIKELVILTILLSGIASAGCYNDTELKEALILGRLESIAIQSAIDAKNNYQSGNISAFEYSNLTNVAIKQIEKANDYISMHWPNDPTLIQPTYYWN